MRPWLAALVAALSIALVAPPVTRPAFAADTEEFDEFAKANCEILDEFLGADALGDPYASFLRAGLYGTCLTNVAGAELSDVNDEIDAAPDKDPDLTKRRRDLAKLIGATTSATRAVEVAADGGSHRLGAFGVSGYENAVRKGLIKTTDLRFLGLLTFRAMWQESIAGGQFRTVQLLESIDTSIDELDEAAGADRTGPGRKALKLAVLAAEVARRMQDDIAALGIPEDQLPSFGESEDRAAKRRRKHFKGLAADYGAGLVALAKIDHKVGLRVRKAIEKAGGGGPTEPMPGHFFADVAPGDYYTMLLANNGTGTGYIANGWEFARVGAGRETITSREQLWERMSAIVASAERDYELTFANLYDGALSFDRRGVPIGSGQFVTPFQKLTMDAAAVAGATHADWQFGASSYPEWEGYLATRVYNDGTGAVMRIVVAYIDVQTPPIVKPLQEVITPGEYQLYHALVLGPLEDGEVHLPARTVRIQEAVQLYDEILDEMETLRGSFETVFSPHVAMGDVADISRRHAVLNDCGPAIFVRGILDTSRAPYYLFFQRYVCEPSEQDPFPSAVNLTIGFERVGD